VTLPRALRVAALLFAVTACRPTWSIALEEGSTGAAPAFALTRDGATEPARIAAFRVDGCAARGSPPLDTQWLTLAPGAAEPVARIVYATPPAGWRSAQGPHPLTPGCYRAAIANAAPLEFDVLTDGRVTARR
jgi:hypothetical protein